LTIEKVGNINETNYKLNLFLNREYPTFKDEGADGGNPADKQNFISLIKELRAEFVPKGYLLTAAVSPGKAVIDKAYDVPKMFEILDYVSVMSYDYHGAWENVTGHNAPLHPKSSDSERDRQFTVEFTIDYYIKKGATPSKLVSSIHITSFYRFSMKM